MGCNAWWLSLAFCFVAFATLKGDETPEPEIFPFKVQGTPGPEIVTFRVRDDGTPEPPLQPFRDSKGATEVPPVTVYEEDLEVDDEWNEIEDDDDDEEEVEDEMEPLVADFMDTNPEVVNGQPVFESDILLTVEQRRALRQRKGLASSNYRWPNGPDGNPLVPYIFTSGSLDEATIIDGMNHWMEHTCIKFEETTNTNQAHLRYIYGGGCYSYMGKISGSGQDISIGSGCNTLGIVAHEIGHAIGFSHEQSRPNRDDFVVINLENIDDNREGNFDKYPTSYINDQNIPYDYSSDMHYGSTAFSINGKTTITTKDPLAQPLIGQRDGLSHRDKHLANIMYGCIDKWLADCEESADPCQNGGYYGADCVCVCPPGTSGSNCETVTGGYYDALINSCTEKITEAGTITSPNHPNNYPAGRCVKWIEAPECQVPRLTFSSFEMYGRNPYCSGNTCCYFDALEIRSENMNYGDVFCDTDISAGQSFTGTSREMILFFRTVSNYHPGFSAELTFVPADGCQTPAPSTEKESTTEETITSTEASTPACLLENYNGVYYWSSPDFGNSNYPDSFRCGVRAENNNYALQITLESFSLQGKVNEECLDYAKFTTEFDRIKTLCGRKRRRTFRSPTFTFLLEFSTDESVNNAGFNISIRATTSDCHKTLRPAAGETGVITVPRKYRSCNYQILAPAGSQIRIDEITPKVRKTPDCVRDWILLNGNSESWYPKDTSEIICGWDKVMSPMTSTTGEMFVAYKATRRSRGFELKYTVL